MEVKCERDSKEQNIPFLDLYQAWERDGFRVGFPSRLGMHPFTSLIYVYP